MKIQRFLVENYGSSIENLEFFFQQAFNYAKEQKIDDITLFVGTKQSFKNGIIGEYIGKTITKQLYTEGTYNIPSGPTIFLKTPRSLSTSQNFGLVLGIYLLEKELDILDSITHAKAIAYISWLEEDAEQWLSMWNPTVWGDSTLAIPERKLPETAIEQLNRLTNRINLSTGLAHPSDKKAAEEVFKYLSKEQILLSSQTVKQWAVRNGWQSRHADQLAKIAKKYNHI